MMKIKILIFTLFIFANLNLVIAEPIENEYGIVNAWFNGKEATVENVQLKISEPIEIKVEVTSKVKCHVATWKGSIHREQFHLTNEVSTHREHF